MLTTVCAVSLAEALRTRFTMQDAVISISSPDEILRMVRTPALASPQAVLWIQFHDVTEPIETDCGVWEPLSDAHAEAIIRFILDVHTATTRLVIHCEEGRSRSVAVARALGHLDPSLQVLTPFADPGDLIGNPVVFHQVLAAAARTWWTSPVALRGASSAPEPFCPTTSPK